jgi:hypothetical protein
MGEYRAVKIVYRESFDSDRPYQREFDGIRQFEPISRSHPSQVNILHVGKGEGCFFYVMELADQAEPKRSDGVAVPKGSSGVLESWSAGVLDNFRTSRRRPFTG